MFKWIKSLFGSKVENVAAKKVDRPEIIGKVTYTHPKNPYPTPRRVVEPVKKAPRITADDIRSWMSAVREYDSVRSIFI